VAYFPDLSEYTYIKHLCRPNTLNVGWLDATHPFEKEKTSAEVVSILWDYCKYSIGQTRGFQFCGINCCEYSGTIEYRRSGVLLKLGSAEVRVFGAADKIYAAPNLVYHYVSEHDYKMPDEFVIALMSGPPPGSDEYLERLRASNIPSSMTLSNYTREEAIRRIRTAAQAKGGSDRSN